VPSSLFRNGEVGVIYDPSDLTSMFQGRTGTTAAAVDSPVGMLLDKSQWGGKTYAQVAAAATEIVTNGGFDTDTIWTKGSGWSISGGAAIAVAVPAFTVISQPYVPVAGRSYEFTLVVGSLTSGSVRAGFTGGTVVSFASVSSAGTYSFVLVADAESTSIFIGPPSGGFNGSINSLSVKEIPGNHAVAPTDTARPILRQDGSLYYLEFDGVDGCLVTPTITPGTDKVQVFAGVRKLSDASLGILAEFSASADSNNGSFYVSSPLNGSGSFYSFISRGTTPIGAVTTDVAFAAPITNVLTGFGDISGDLVTLRADGVQVAQSTSNQGTGNYLAYPLYIGMRAGSSLPFNGHLYGLTVRFGPNLEASQIDKMEAYMAKKTGVTL